MGKQDESESNYMRIDRWLWCARFYKSRKLAAEAVKNGKILVDNVRPKPAKMIRPGENLKIRRGPFVHDIEILSLPVSRIPARDTAGIYRETSESVSDRELLATRLKMEHINYPKSRGRPTKHDRRELIRFKTKL